MGGDVGGRDPGAMALAMADTLSHRGPDGRDSWADVAAGIGLGHRRLAIVDLTPTGAQPMHSADGRYVITYNGEVYNFVELRSELKARGHRFRGTSDTEVMLAACVQWGVKEATMRFAGMFAFAVFDRQTRTLMLVRDRLGVKPIYWTIAGGVLLFGSELRALMAHPSFRKDLDRDAIGSLVRSSYIPAPASVFRNVHKLPAGSILTAQAGRGCKVERYWNLLDHIHEEMPDIEDIDAQDELDRLLRQSIRQRMIADVPVGAFLSGGFDSSTVVAVMQALSNQPVRTFTIGFEDASYDETKHARTVARHIGTDHTEVRLGADAALALVDDVADWFDEPFADSSQLPSFLVARATREHVTGALSGDGGDEVFAGYPKYQLFDRIWRRAGRLPPPLRKSLGALLATTSERALERIAPAFLEAGRAERLGEKTRRLAHALGAETVDDAIRAISAVGLDRDIVIGANGNCSPAPATGALPVDLISRMQVADIDGYLPDDILTKVDRCSMAVSLETREPLLDHRLMEFVWSLPEPVRHSRGRYKGLLRAVLDRYVPPALTERPKRGFSIPLGSWLRDPLREWAEDLLAPRRLAAGGIFHPERTRKIWERHLAGTESNPTGLWNVLMVQAWSRRWL